jgi:hypothetical protein
MSNKKDTNYRIKKISAQLTTMLLSKNASYGDSALNPLKIFSKGDATTNLCCRIEDKLARIANKGLCDDTYDTVWDLAGYFILLIAALDDGGLGKEIEDIELNPTGIG